MCIWPGDLPPSALKQETALWQTGQVSIINRKRRNCHQTPAAPTPHLTDGTTATGSTKVCDTTQWQSRTPTGQSHQSNYNLPIYKVFHGRFLLYVFSSYEPTKEAWENVKFQGTARCLSVIEGRGYQSNQIPGTFTDTWRSSDCLLKSRLLSNLRPPAEHHVGDDTKVRSK